MKTSNLVLLSGVILSCYGGYIPAKAVLAQHLITVAWNRSITNGLPIQPWSWADTYPVMKLSSKKHDQTLMVLSGDHGPSLAFGPGHNPQSFFPGKGTTMISAHRDTHFSFLQDVVIGDEFQITDNTNQHHHYRVNTIKIIDSRTQHITINHEVDNLKLITCWPFDALTSGSPYRYVITATPYTEQEDLA